MPGVDDSLVAKLCSRRVFSTASPVKKHNKRKTDAHGDDVLVSNLF